MRCRVRRSSSRRSAPILSMTRITPETPSLECDFEKGCTAALSIKLVLNAGGTLAPRLPTGNGWQIGVAQNGVFLTRCPQHHQLLEEPTAPRLGDLRIAKH